MLIRHAYRPHCMALAISVAFGHAGCAIAEQSTVPIDLPAEQRARLEALINDPATVRTPITKPETGADGIALKLGDDHDLVTVSRRGRFDGLVDGGGGNNALQLDTANGGELGESRNFDFLHIKRGQWTLTGADDFRDGAIVMNNATLTNHGSIVGQVSVDKRGTFRGNGQVGHLQVEGHLEVNALHGAPRVRGDLTLYKTAELAYEVNPDGRSETIKVDGTARLGDATLKIVAVTGEYPVTSQYSVIEAGRIEGEFGKVRNDLAFLTPTLQYNEKTVGLTFVRNDVEIESVAISANGREFAQNISQTEEIPSVQVPPDAINSINAPSPLPVTETSVTAAAPTTVLDTSVTAPVPTVQPSAETSLAPPATQASGTAQTPSPVSRPTVASFKPAQVTNAAIAALMGANKTTAARALEQLAGGSNANLGNATLTSVNPVSTSMLSAMRQLDSTQLIYSKGSPRLTADGENNGRVWLQALGNGGTLDRGQGSSALRHATKGLVLGADWTVDEQWRLGVIGGKSRTRLDANQLDGNLESVHLGAYALRQSGPLAIRLGATHSSHDGSSKRRVAFNGFSDRLKGNYDASTRQAFAELGYNLGTGNLSAEPFANLGYQRYQRDGYTEKGGPAALQVEGQTQDNIGSTFGLRLARLNTLDNGMRLTPSFSAGWKHIYGDIDSRTRQKLKTGSRSFTVRGTALDRDSLSLDAALELSLSPRHTLGVGYNGEVGSDSRSHGVTGQWRMAF
ncbi:autotransporter outer membrane beta-barrel domain-containing protein [Pseudomonas sp. GM48]|uniref:autotransporter outer membrane beta-barrel domain-containing protein n=1 Tax=Pseudomonas sp. GM48 TaxID=1144330 RepID=UPI0002704A71|nr:autotransporter outer membrane beta-barrel domain-containing protein [Pseudomonas sp. GM48]EJM53517.1 outer membrane autotransporter barrel domain-containing protein [Pseudomonas sp. GM48]